MKNRQSLKNSRNCASYNLQRSDLNIKTQSKLIIYHNVLKHVDNIITTYKVHVMQFNIQDIKCTALLTYKWKNYFHYSATRQFFPIPYVYTIYTRLAHIYILVLIAVLFTWSPQIMAYPDIIWIHNTTTIQYVQFPNK